MLPTCRGLFKFYARDHLQPSPSVLKPGPSNGLADQGQADQQFVTAYWKKLNRIVRTAVSAWETWLIYADFSTFSSLSVQTLMPRCLVHQVPNKLDSDENARFDACNGPFLRGDKMRLHWTLGTAVFLATLVASSQSPAMETSFTRLRALAARQDLYDEICYARVDGSISPAKCTMILMDAKELLSPEEYLKFRKALDRIAPPPKSSPNQLAKARNADWRTRTATPPMKPSPNQLAKTLRKKPDSPNPQQPSQQPVPDSGPVMPAGVTLPDRIAPPMFSR